jgi:hypothetical protein
MKDFFTFAKTLDKSFRRYSYLEMDLNSWHKDFWWAKASQKFGFFVEVVQKSWNDFVFPEII